MRPCTIIWTEDDVQTVVSDMNAHYKRFQKDPIKLSTQEVEYVLRAMEENHDSSVGVTWDTIEFWVEDALQKRNSEEL
jgi:hypothetical protein